MRIQKHVDIDRPIDKVFAFISDPNNDPVWCPTVSESTQVVGETPEPGAVYEQVHKPGPAKPTALEVEILEKEVPRHLRLKSTDELGWFDVRYDLQPLPDGGTRLTQVDETHFQGFARVLQPVLWVAIQAGIRSQFKRLKELLEAREVSIPGDG